MRRLFLVNIPYNYSDRELKDWVESRGIETRSIRIVRDLVSGVSPSFGYVEVRDHTVVGDAIAILNGKKMRNQIIHVREAPVRTAFASTALESKSA
jgi:RNA recognition motif-containing protein